MQLLNVSSVFDATLNTDPELQILIIWSSMLHVLSVLQDNQDNITSTDCQEEVFYYQLMEVQDFRNDVILAEACRVDVDKYCKDVEPGGWGGENMFILCLIWT